jgi:hypothetical protein
VYRIDPVTDQVAASIHLGGSPFGVAVGAGWVWVTRPLRGPGQLIRIDPSNARVTSLIKVGPGPGQVVYGQHAVWVQNTSPASVMRVDPVSGRVATVIDTAPVLPGSPGPGTIAVGYGSLWSAANGSLTRLDPSTDQLIGSVAIPRAVALALGAGELWVLTYPRSSSPTTFKPIRHTAALWEIDPRNDRIVGRPIHLDALQPIAITASHKRVWVGNYESQTVTPLRLVACHRTAPK